MACKDAEALERHGKAEHLKNIAYFTIQRMKNGRRSTGDHRTDVMAPGCRMDGRAELLSLDAPLTNDDHDSDVTFSPAMTLGDVLAGRRDDPCIEAGRRMEWAEFIDELTPEQHQVVRDTAAGYGTGEQAERMDITAPAVVCRKRTVARRAREFWGDEVLNDTADTPLWRKSLRYR